MTKNFNRINTLLGWGLFIGATLVYALTVEPTASFWDCGEYIAAAYKLQVTHPPGAPFFLLLARMFAFLAGHNTEKVAFWINMSSVVASAGSVMVVFWIISLLGRKLFHKSMDQLPKHDAVAIWGAALVGALALTFCGTFWFTATETETYAFSMLVMCLAIWAMLKWEQAAETPQSNRWLILVAYLLGLSLGMRIFSLLTIPGLGLIFYFKKTTQPNVKGAIQTLLISGFIILTIYIGIIPGLPTAALKWELFCVNQLGWPFQSGIILFSLLLVSMLVYGLIYSIKKEKLGLNISLLCFIFILLGYGSFGSILIRAKANPPINENNPSDAVSFISYLKREQYGHRALIYGPHFGARIIDQKQGDPVYRKTANKYELVTHKPKPIFDAKGYILLPRIWSQAPHHIAAYRNLLGLHPKEQPKFKHNLKFLLSHQIGYFYLRYFLWNFAGRASDNQGALWLTPLDAFKTLPDAMANNPARSNLLFLPLLLGLLGLFFQYHQDKHAFWVVLTLFVMLGVALVFYLNPPPIEPRERDYIYVGSFLIFTIWIGLGTLTVIDYLRPKFNRPMTATVLGIIMSLSVPTIMAAQGWRAHDRTGRYFSVDSAKNLLTSCGPNAILFTGGDNDTFPLWYAQEVEGFRTDVRVIVLTYANTAWYIKQLLRPINQSPPIPLSIRAEQYSQYGLNDVLPYMPQTGIQGPLDLQQYLGWIQKGYPDLQVRTITGESTNSIPVKMLHLPINKKEINKKGLVAKAHQSFIADTLTWELKGRILEKKDLLFLDLLVTNNWERPIYFNHTSLNALNIDLKSHVVTEGTAIRLLPIQNTNREELIDTSIMYDNLINRFYWRNLDNPKVYYDDNYRGFISNYRLAFHALADALIKAGEIEKAKTVLIKCLERIPDQAIPYDGASAYMLTLLFEVGETDRALESIRIMGERAESILAYQVKEKLPVNPEMQKQLAILHEITRSLYQAGKDDLGQVYEDIFRHYYTLLER